MRKFEFTQLISQKGLDIISSYENLLYFNGNGFMQESLEKSLRKEAPFISDAIDKQISVEDFRELVIQSGKYKVKNLTVQNAAVQFAADIIEKSGIQADAFPKGRTKITIQKRVGLRVSCAMNYFDISHERALELSNGDFLNIFVDTYIRKLIVKSTQNFNYPNVLMEISDVYVPEKRKHLHNINVDFTISIDHLTDEAVGYILSEISTLEDQVSDFL